MSEALATTGAAADPFTFSTGTPTRKGMYAAYVDCSQRQDKQPGLYAWDGENWQCAMGWFDGAVTHWMWLDCGEGEPADAEDDDLVERPWGAK
jgi:hypothetical protein